MNKTNKKVAPKTAAELKAAADKLAADLKQLRNEARKAAAQEEAERLQMERQKEIDEAVELGRAARETVIGNMTVADFLRLSDAERQSIVGVGDARLNEQRNAMMEFLQKERTRSSDGGKFRYWDNFLREHPGVFNA